MNRNADILSPKEANRYLADFLVQNAETNLRKGQLISGLKKYDNHMDPGAFKDLVESKIGGLEFPELGAETGIKGAKGQEPRRLKVYDSKGHLVGTVNTDEVDQLPKGYIAQ